MNASITNGAAPNGTASPIQSRGSNDPNIPHPSSSTRPIVCKTWPTTDEETGYEISHHVIGEPFPNATAPFKIIMIGAGAAGIDFIHHAKRTFKDEDVTFHVYEKNADVGGTWFENRYPGCACDVPSVSYSFSWRPNLWTKYYSSSPEIWRYMKTIADEEDMYRYIGLRTRVVNALWQEDKSKWLLTLEKTDEKGDVERAWDEECDVLLNGSGVLNNWKWPDITGLSDFQGTLFHTAQYDESFDLKGKRVAVIGSGSSGVQTVAAIYPHVSKVYTWVRSRTWITAGFGQKYAGPGGTNFDYSAEQKEEWRKDPEKYREYRKMVEAELNHRFRLVLRNSQESDEANAFAYKEMISKLGPDSDLAGKIIPQDFNVSCRRPTPGNGYLEALVAPKTTVYTENIGCITPKGFKNADGIEVEVDVIICATGFDTSYRPRFPIIGLDGTSIAEKWSKFPTTYPSVAVPLTPNYFSYIGPFGPVGQGSILPLHTLTSNYIIEVVKKMRHDHIRRLYPKESVVKQFATHAQLYLKRTSWADPCSSWFKQGRKDGPVVMWPGSRLAFFDLMKEPRYEDFEIEYWSGNRWGYLGSGFHEMEFDGSDTTFYLDCELFGLGVTQDIENGSR
jgi:cation diffusion facilitator CzcD-associated flavoprotein CzcO